MVTPLVVAQAFGLLKIAELRPACGALARAWGVLAVGNDGGFRHLPCTDVLRNAGKNIVDRLAESVVADIHPHLNAGIDLRIRGRPALALIHIWSCRRALSCSVRWLPDT